MIRSAPTPATPGQSSRQRRDDGDSDGDGDGLVQGYAGEANHINSGFVGTNALAFSIRNAADGVIARAMGDGNDEGREWGLWIDPE